MMGTKRLRKEARSRRDVRAATSARIVFAQAKRLYNSARAIQDYRNGFSLLKQAAESGLPDANEWLGFVYHYGLGTQSNRRLAFKRYKLAGDASLPNAEYHVGVFYYSGIGVRRDRQEALLWINRAAKHGSANAMSWLGYHYLAAGVPRRGFELMLKAANRGEPYAQDAVGV